MKKSRIYFLSSACIAGVVAAWTLGRRPAETPRVETTSHLAPAVKTASPSIPNREAANAVHAPLPQAKPEAPGSIANTALAHETSPLNSPDLDKNRDWARNFPVAAAAWLKTAPEGEQRLVIAEIACPDLARTDAAAATKLAESCMRADADEATRYLLESMAHRWAEQDMPAAAAWAFAKPAGAQRDRLLQRIALVQAKTRPAAAAQLVFEKMSPGEYQNEAAIGVLHQWTRQDALAALAWVEAFPAGNLRDRALQEVENATVASGETPSLN
jgi:hypothetical protein